VPDVDYLLVSDVARLRRVKVTSIYRYINLARVHRDAGRPWPSDIPIPADRDALVKGGRVWLRWPADGPIAAWIARTADQHPETEREDTA
jgi:hypothetical protein